MRHIPTLLIALIVGLFSTEAVGQRATVSGYVYDNETGEALIGATVREHLTGSGVQSNTYGFYSITPGQEKVDLEFSYVGYSPQRVSFQLQRDTSLHIYLEPVVQLEAVEVQASRTDRVQESVQVSAINVPIRQIQSAPVILGEQDVLKVLQLLPGVQSGSEGQSGLFVRGGSPDQNLILLDGVPVYNAYHLFGFFSVFNTDAIRDVNLIKGGFPARYGGRLSSVVDISLKEGNNREFRGAASIGLLAARVTVEGPIIEGRTSFIFSARRTYIDLLTRPLIRQSFRQDGDRGDLGVYFYDLNAKVNHRIDDNNRVFLSVYSGDDNFYLRREDREPSFNEIHRFNSAIGWGNVTAAARWNRQWNPRLFSNTTLTYSRYRLFTRIKFESEHTVRDDYEEISLKYDSGIRDVGGRIDFDYLPDPRHHIRFGLNFVQHRFNTGLFELRDIVSADDYFWTATVGEDPLSASEFFVYAEDEFDIDDRWKVNAGLHFSGFLVSGEQYFSLQPRVSGRYLFPASNSSVKLAFSTMQQNVHLLANEGIGLPTDLWVPATDNILPQKSWQIAAGYAKEIGRSYNLTLEAYYKDMSNVISYGEGEGVFGIDNWEDRVTQGDGYSYGLEFFLHKRDGRFNGWLGYTLSWTYRKFEDLNFGRRFPFRYDRRHDISLVGNYKLTDRIGLSASWVYGTGNAITIPESRYLGTTDEGRGRFYQYFGERNSYRMESYHRLDIGVNFHRVRTNYERTFSVGAYNAYANQNPFFVHLDERTVWDSSTNTNRQETVLRQVNLFPLLPYVTYSIKF